jgi:DNA polymerase (family 10)
MNGVHCRMAKKAGVKITVATDAHSAERLELMGYGIEQARCGWVGAVDVIHILICSCDSGRYSQMR